MTKVNRTLKQIHLVQAENLILFVGILRNHCKSVKEMMLCYEVIKDVLCIQIKDNGL